MLKSTDTAKSAEVLVAGILASVCRQQAYAVLSRINVAEFSQIVVDKLRRCVDAVQWQEHALPNYARLNIQQVVT